MQNLAEECHREVQFLAEAGLPCGHAIALLVSLLVVDFTTQTLAAADGHVGSGGRSISHNLYFCDDERNSSVSPTATPKKSKCLALEDGSDRKPKRASHADSATSRGRPTSALGTIGAPCTPRPTATSCLPCHQMRRPLLERRLSQRRQWSILTSPPRVWVVQKVQLPRIRQSELWVMVAGTSHPPL